MAGQSNTIQISYEQLSQGKYVRNGDDLSITTENLWGDAETVLLKNYFETSPDLVTAKGSTLKGNIVNLLAVDSQPNTSNVAFEDPNAIGKITTADLPVIVQRADQFIELQKGDLIYLNDIIDAKDGSVGIAFKDDSSISVDPGAKMVIDDFVYDPAEPTTGSMNANIITGNFSFISGQIAKTGNDSMQVTTPVLTIGVRGTQVAGKANQDGEENEIVLLPNDDGTVGQVMITNQSGSVLLTEAFQATTIATALQPPTVPVILPKEIVLKKFAKTIATTKKTKKLRETEKEAEEAAKEKVEAEGEKEELEEEKEELEEEQEELEEEAEALEDEAEALEEEKEELEEEAEALEEEAEALEEEAEALEEEAELVEQEKEQVEEQAEALEEKAEELEKKLEEVPVEEKEQIEKELEAIEEEILEVEEIKEEIEQKVQEVEEKIQEVEEQEQIIEEKAVEIEQQEQIIEEKAIEIEQQVQEVEQQVQIVEEKFEEVEQQFVQVEEKIVNVEQKFEQIEQDFEVFQQEFEQEFKEYIPEAEIKQFMEEAPEELIQDYQEKVIEELKAENIEIQENVNQEPEDIFAEEAVQEKLEQIEEKQEELIEKADELMEKDMQLQEEAQALEEEAKALEEEVKRIEEEAEQAYANNDQEAIEAIEKDYEKLEEKQQQIDQGFEQLDEQYEELDENFQELNNDFFAMDEELNEVFGDGPMVVRIPEEGPGYNEDEDMFMVPEDQQIEVNVEEFLQAEKNQAIENNIFAEEADNFFNDQEIQEALPDEIDQNVQDMMIIQAQDLDDYFIGAGAGINNVEDFYADDPMEDFYDVVDNNQVLYEAEIEGQNWFDDFVENMAVEQNINVAPWLDMPNNVTVSEGNAQTSGTVVGYVYGSDANGDTLTYSIFDDPTGGLAINGNTITWDGTFGNITQDTTYTVLLKVQDPYGASDIDSFTITVTNDNYVIAENVLDFEDVHSGNDGGEIAYKQNVGYYGMNTGQGDTTNQARIIENTGHTATNLTNVRTADIQNIDIMYVHNGSNIAYGYEWLTGTGQANTSSTSSASSDVWSWVNDGGILLIQDRYVTGANNMLLGESAVITRQFNGTNDDTDFRTELNDTLLYNGAAGTLTNNTLDGGGHTDHGYIINLGTGEVGIGHRGSGDSPNGEFYNNAFAYKYGSGLVYYDTYPMDLWDAYGVQSTYSASSTLLAGGAQTYNENLIQWAASLYYDGASQINGTGSAETIFGTMGDDTIFSKDGGDELWGGAGSDTYLYKQTYQSNSGSHDTILDFDHTTDRIDISNITNGAGISRTLSNGTRFKLDTDNNGSYEMEFELTGYTGTADDVTVLV